MKYLIILADGAGDRPLDCLGGLTPLQKAQTPNLDMLARGGSLGLTKTLVPEMPLGSDVANLAVLGYQPKLYYTGRSPIEALGLDLPVGDDDMVFRCNLVNIDYSGALEGSVMIDHSADKITDAEGAELTNALAQFFSEKYPALKFYVGASYRNIMVWQDYLQTYQKDGGSYTPPHDILTKPITDYLPKGDSSAILTEMMRASVDFLSSHPVNQKRCAKGLKPANCIWFWGEGTRPKLDNFKQKYGLTGAMITAVPLLSGIANGTGMTNIHVDGATGDIHTNFEGKADAAIAALHSDYDLVFVHLEAPDECGHDGNADEKVLSIEYIDRRVLGRILDGTNDIADLRILVMPDHATPTTLRTHTVDEIPFLIWDKAKQGSHSAERFTEADAKRTGYVIENGYEVILDFIN